MFLSPALMFTKTQAQGMHQASSGWESLAQYLVCVDLGEQLGVLLAQLLEHGLQYLRVGLHQHAQRLELRIVPQECQRSSWTRGSSTAAQASRHPLGRASHHPGLACGALVTFVEHLV